MAVEDKTLQSKGAQGSEGRVITFYSYKGGVGRSMVLANVAYILAESYGLRVIVVDWDLEAPGLHRYFGIESESLKFGVIDYFNKYKTFLRDPKHSLAQGDLEISKYFVSVEAFKSGGSIKLLPAGAGTNTSEYGQKVREFDWTDLYRQWGGAQLIEKLRAELKTSCDICLIDSRTGITDIGGICTVQLPDLVVFVFALNDQNIAGIEQVARELANPKNPTTQALKRRPRLVFVPARKELSEVARLREWEGRAAVALGPYCHDAALESRFGDVRTYLRKMSVPYVPYFAYGEEIAAESAKGIELSESFTPLIETIIGRNVAPSRQNMQRQRTKELLIKIAEPALGVSFVLVVLLVVGFGSYKGYLFISEWAYSNIGPSLLESETMGQIVSGGFGGLAGATLSAARKFYGDIENSKTVSQTNLYSSRLIIDLMAGAVSGILASILTKSGAPLLTGAIAGYLWPLVAGDIFRRMRKQ